MYNCLVRNRMICICMCILVYPIMEIYVYICLLHNGNIYNCFLYNPVIYLYINMFVCFPHNPNIVTYIRLPLNRMVYVYITVHPLMEIYVCAHAYLLTLARQCVRLLKNGKTYAGPSVSPAVWRQVYMAGQRLLTAALNFLKSSFVYAQIILRVR